MSASADEFPSNRSEEHAVSAGFSEAGESKPPREAFPEQALPPVAPPTAAFILQLFLIPLVIVSLIVAVWLLFSWAAWAGANPHDLVKGLERGDDSAWQKAVTLADLLRNPEHAQLKQDARLAGELADVLRRQLANEQPNENDVRLRMFVCRALGEFHVDAGVPALLEAARLQRVPAELDGRRAAIEALAVLATQVGPERVPRRDELFEALLAASRETEPQGDARHDPAMLRATAAYALGVLGGEAALARLAELLEDAHANTRYNAAAGLARQGDSRALPVLYEMLDPGNKAAVASEATDSGREWKAGLVQMNGVRAAEMLAERDAALDRAPLRQKLETLAKSDASAPVKTRARELLLRWKP